MTGTNGMNIPTDCIGDGKQCFPCPNCHPRHFPPPPETSEQEGRVHYVHNHGPEEGKGLACRERRVNGRLVGECVAGEGESDAEFLRNLSEPILPTDDVRLNKIADRLDKLDRLSSPAAEAREEGREYRPGSAIGERCSVCGEEAWRKVEEEIFDDDPQPIRHPLTAYLCMGHFTMVMHGHAYDRNPQSPALPRSAAERDGE